MSTLIIDSLSLHSDDASCLAIHPAHLRLSNCFEKGFFSKIIIKNTKSELLTGKIFFNLCRCLSDAGTLELEIFQPIAVMQKLDAGEIEANAKLGGFSRVESEECEVVGEMKGVKTKVRTIKMEMKK